MRKLILAMLLTTNKIHVLLLTPETKTISKLLLTTVLGLHQRFKVVWPPMILTALRSCHRSFALTTTINS